MQAALREGFEEINIAPDHVKVLSELRPSLTRNLKNNVTPVVTVCDEEALSFLKPQVDEVQSVYLVGFLFFCMNYFSALDPDVRPG